MFFVLCALVFLIYFLGEHAGGQNAARSAKVRDVINAKAKLDTEKNKLYSDFTPPGFLYAIVLAIIVVILMLFGRWTDDDDHYYHRRRH